MFSDTLKTLLGKTILKNHGRYFPLLVKGNHEKGSHLQRLAPIINQFLERENPGKQLHIDKKIVSGWILRCVELVQVWRAEAEVESQAGGDRVWSR